MILYVSSSTPYKSNLWWKKKIRTVVASGWERKDWMGKGMRELSVLMVMFYVFMDFGLIKQLVKTQWMFI